MSTYLQTINAVMVKLREAEVSTITDEYTKLIARFVNEAKEEVEDAWNWTTLRTSSTVSAVSTATVYSLTGTSKRTRIIGAYNTTSKAVLKPVGYSEGNEKIELFNTTSGKPIQYDVVGVDANGALKVRVFPTPDGNYTLTFYYINPQADLTTAQGGTEILVPANPVIQLAYALAIKERGEDKGQLSPFQDQSYLWALGKAISQDEALHGDETTWQAI